MKKTKYITTRYDVNDDFYVEVSPNGDVIEFVLCMKNYGIKSYMFGLCKKDCPKKNWEEMIKNSIGNYIDDFYSDIYNVFELKKIEQAKQETREILREIKQKYGKSCSEYYPEWIEFSSVQLSKLAKEHGIELE